MLPGYTSEDVDARLAEALQRRGYDVETAVAAGLLEASDEEQLAYVVSHNEHWLLTTLDTLLGCMLCGWRLAGSTGYHHSHWAFVCSWHSGWAGTKLCPTLNLRSD